MVHRRTRLIAAAGASLAATLLALPLASDAYADHGGGGGGSDGTSLIPLPNGFQPEDITAGPNHTFFTGSLATGAIYEGSFRSSSGRLLVSSATGPTTGLFLQRGHDDGRALLWAAGGPSGQARVYDADTGALLQTWQFAPAGSGAFISDVVVTSHAAYYTDAFWQQLYVIPLGDRQREARHHHHEPGDHRSANHEPGDDHGHHGDHHHGEHHHHGPHGPHGHHGNDVRLPSTTGFKVVPLTGAVRYQSGDNVFNLNGLAAFGDTLVSAQTVTGKLFSIDPTTGMTREIPIRDRNGNPVTVAGADGIAQRGGTLYVAQNTPNRIATLHVSSDLRSARLDATTTDPALDVPSSVEEDSGDLFALNARFTTPASPTTAYDVVKLHR